MHQVKYYSPSEGIFFIQVQVLTVNQVVEIILKFLEAKDWKDSFFRVIPQRKRCDADLGDCDGEIEGNDSGEEKDAKEIGIIEDDDVENKDDLKIKRRCIET